MHRTIGMSGGRLLVRSTSAVGPRHDPYSRTTVELKSRRDNALIWRLVSCALAGDWLDRDGRKVLECGIGADKDEQRQYWEAVERETGGSPHFWIDRVWGLRENARWRAMSPDERWQYEMAMEADDALMRYAE